MIIKCKMCGGDIQFNMGDTVGQCEYCGSSCTIPKVDEEQKINRYNRANHFRRQAEFDKALSAYEKILEEDDTDSEAHWGAVLSRYGIEYVEDPATKKRIPTCHRVQLSSILADEDYRAALEYAPDSESRKLYEEEAARIAEIQRGILAISQNEKPYDVFICYKETDENGQRTHDSQWAQEIYYGLTEQGFNVFFSRITLEDKLGQEYEPYIFAALNSAKVMLVIGSKPEYFNAVWVKNEWSRYLALMAKDRKRLLIPCYRGMDPYDLPDELSNLQSQDMSKIGFMQDLLRGVRKALDAEKKPEAPKAQPQPTAPVSPAQGSASALLRRAFLALEDGEFDRADDFCEQALNLDPENAEAYLGKLMAELKVRKREDLKNVSNPFDSNANYKKVIRFGNAALREEAEGYIRAINERNENNRKQMILDEAVLRTQQAVRLEHCESARKELETILGYTGVAEALKECDKRIEQFKSRFYNAACEQQDKKNWQSAIQQFEELGDYRDSRERAQACRNAKAAEDKAAAEKREQERLIAERQAKEAAARTRRNAIIGVLLAAAAAAVFFVVTKIVIPKGHYDKGVSLRAAGQWDEAVAEFEAAGEYSDAAAQIPETRYDKGIELCAAQKWNEAATEFEQAREYADSYEKFREATYQCAKKYLEEGDILNAGMMVSKIRDYKDCDSLISEMQKAREKLKSRVLVFVFNVVCLLDDGTVTMACKSDSDSSYLINGISSWSDIVAITASGSVLFGLKTNGTVVCRSYLDGDEEEYEEVKSWTDIVAIDGSETHVVGLRSDGTVVVAGGNTGSDYYKVDDWNNIKSVSAGWNRTIGIKQDGTAVCAGVERASGFSEYPKEPDVTGWQDIVSVFPIEGDTYALKSDGTVLSSKHDKEVDEWGNIIDLAGEDDYTIVGLKADGTIVSAGLDFDWEDKEWKNWTDIVAVDAVAEHIVAVKSDGTVVASGNKNSQAYDVKNWKGIVAVSTGYDRTVGIQSDGSIVVTENMFDKNEERNTVNILSK